MRRGESLSPGKSASSERAASLLERRRRAAEERLGMPVIVRGVRTPDASWKGRLYRRRGRVIIEYQISQSGFFWHAPIVERLLDAAGEGQTEAVIPA